MAGNTAWGPFCDDPFFMPYSISFSIGIETDCLACNRTLRISFVSFLRLQVKNCVAAICCFLGLMYICFVCFVLNDHLP